MRQFKLNDSAPYWIKDLEKTYRNLAYKVAIESDNKDLKDYYDGNAALCMLIETLADIGEVFDNPSPKPRKYYPKRKLGNSKG